MPTKQRMSSPHVPEPPPQTWSNCLVVGNQVFTAGMTARTGTAVEGGSSMYEQARAVFSKIKYLIEAAGGHMDDVVKVNIFVTDITRREEVWQARREFFTGHFPVSTLVEVRLAEDPFPVSQHERWLVVGAGRDWPTALEAVLKLREGAHVAAEAHQTEQLLHGHLAAIDDGVRCFVLRGEGRAAERADAAVQALHELGCDVTVMETSHPVVDIVPFQRLAVDLARERGVDPDMIRWDEDRWDRARKAVS